jgi:hypothetical protein
MPFRKWADLDIPGLEATFEIERGDHSVVLNDRTMPGHYHVTDIEGLHDTSERRESRQPRPSNHGTERGQVVLDEKVVAFTGQTRAGSIPQLRAMQKDLKRIGNVDPLRQEGTDARLLIKPVDAYLLQNFGRGVHINWLSNPNFSKGMFEWEHLYDANGASVTAAVEVDQREFSHFGRKSTYGTTSIYLDVTTSGVGLGQYYEIISEPIPLREEASLFWASIYARIASTTGAFQRTMVRWYDAASRGLLNTQIGSDNTSTGIVNHYGSVVQPVGARYARLVIAVMGSGSTKLRLTNAMLCEGAGPFHFIGPGMPGCVYREMPKRFRQRYNSSKYSSGYWIGHREHNLCSNPSFTMRRAPENSSSTLDRVVMDRTVLEGGIAPRGYEDPSFSEVGKLDPLGLSQGDLGLSNGFAIDNTANGTTFIGEQPIPVQGGVLYSFSGFFEPTSLNTRSVQIQVDWYKADGTFASRSFSPLEPERLGAHKWVYYEVVAPFDVASADVTWRVINMVTDEMHIISGRRVSVGSHTEYASGDFPGWSYLGETPGPWADTFSSDSSTQYASHTHGAIAASVSGGALVPSSSAEQRFYKKVRYYTDAQVAVRHRPGSGGTITNYSVGIVVRNNVHRNEDLEGRVSFPNSGQVRLQLYRRRSNTQTLIKETVTNLETPIALTDWTTLIVRAEGNHIAAEFTSGDPEVSYLEPWPAARVAYDLTQNSDDVRLHGESAHGFIGVHWFPATTNARIDYIYVSPARYQDTDPHDRWYGYSEETAPGKYEIEEVEVSVKQAEKQDTNRPWRPFMVTCRARDPRIYSEDRSVIFTMREDLPSYVDQFLPYNNIVYPYVDRRLFNITESNLITDSDGSHIQGPGTSSNSYFWAIPQDSVSSDSRYAELYGEFGDFSMMDVADLGGFYFFVIMKWLDAEHYLAAMFQLNGAIQLLQREGAGFFTKEVDFIDFIEYLDGAATFRAYVEGNNMVAQVWTRGRSTSEAPTHTVVTTLTGATATQYGGTVAGLRGWGTGADFTKTNPVGQLPYAYVRNYREGNRIDNFAKKPFFVGGDVDTDCTITFRGPAINPQIFIPESGIEIYTEIQLDSDQGFTISPKGNLTDQTPVGGTPANSNESNIAPGTILGRLIPGRNTLQVGGQNIFGSIQTGPTGPGNTQVSVAWKDAYQ